VDACHAYDSRNARPPLGRGALALIAAALAIALAAAPKVRAATSLATSSASASPAPTPLAGPQAFITQSQTAPDLDVPPSSAAAFEYGDTVKSLPQLVYRQWVPLSEVPAESTIDKAYFGSIDDEAQRLTLKQAIYLALRDNPNVKVARLDPIAGIEGIRMANAQFDPDFIVTLDEIKSVLPATTPLEVSGLGLATKSYDWNFAVNKALSLTNGVFTILFDNDREITNNRFYTVNPSYTPSLTVGLNQPLLRNFGWKFATISVRLAESAQLQSQFNYAQQLENIVQTVGTDYWNVVAARENLRVAQEALKFNQDLVRVNRISVQVGTLAPIDLTEAQSAEATAQANVFTAEAALRNARATLREDVMYSPKNTFIPETIVPSDKPKPSEPIATEEELSLENAVRYSPSLAALRQQIQSQRLQVKYQRNQLLPNFSIVSEFGINALAGYTECAASFGGTTNCATPTGAPGFILPFGGAYEAALNRMFGFHFYSYTVMAVMEMPMDNAPIQAALGQAKAGYQQLREQYRAMLNQTTVQVETALANLEADQRRVKATRDATEYARQALHDEQVKFKVGMATTHDLLQYQSSLVSAEGNQAQAETDLEKAKIALRYADNTLLQNFQVEFHVHEPHETPWYARF
jgi:outer membrane protein TolC